MEFTLTDFRACVRTKGRTRMMLADTTSELVLCIRESLCDADADVRATAWYGGIVIKFDVRVPVVDVDRERALRKIARKFEKAKLCIDNLYSRTN